MEKTELDIALKSFGEEIAGNIEKKGFLTKEELSAVATELKEFKQKAEQEKEQLNEVISELKRTGVNQVPQVKGLADILQEKSKELLLLKEEGKGKVIIEVKAAGTMTRGNVTAASGTEPFSLTDYDRGITGIPRAGGFIESLIPSKGTTKSNVSYAEMKNPDGGAGYTAEGTAKTQADFDIVEATQKVEKITAYIKVSKESLDDLDSLAGDIEQELLTLIDLKTDTALLSGTGTTPQIKGLLTSATAFSATGFTGFGAVTATTGASEYDVLKVAANQIKIAEVQAGFPAGFIPNVILINPTDATKLELRKDSTANYVIGGYYTAKFPGMTVVENARMTSGSFLVMDSTKASIRNRSKATISIGLENDDFTKNLVTVLCERRLCQIVKSNHTKAFVTGTFAAAKTAMV